MRKPLDCRLTSAEVDSTVEAVVDEVTTEGEEAEVGGITASKVMMAAVTSNVTVVINNVMVTSSEKAVIRTEM